MCCCGSFSFVRDMFVCLKPPVSRRIFCCCTVSVLGLARTAGHYCTYSYRCINCSYGKYMLLLLLLLLRLPLLLLLLLPSQQQQQQQPQPRQKQEEQ